jgi:hypothetical protein
VATSVAGPASALVAASDDAADASAGPSVGPAGDASADRADDVSSRVSSGSVGQGDSLTGYRFLIWKLGGS